MTVVQMSHALYFKSFEPIWLLWLEIKWHLSQLLIVLSFAIALKSHWCNLYTHTFIFRESWSVTRHTRTSDDWHLWQQAYRLKCCAIFECANAHRSHGLNGSFTLTFFVVLYIYTLSEDKLACFFCDQFTHWLNANNCLMKYWITQQFVFFSPTVPFMKLLNHFSVLTSKTSADTFLHLPNLPQQLIISKIVTWILIRKI